MKYQWLLFDLDNTILNFDAAEKESLQNVVKSLGLEFDQRIFNSYHHVNKKCWADFDKGILPQSEIQITRFTKFLERENIDADPKEVGDLYTEGLAKSKHFEVGALEMLNHFYGKVKMAVITNGLKEVQRPHIEINNLMHFFDVIVVSDEIGTYKPKKAFFDYTFEKMENPPKSDVLVIGDGLSSDIKGGQNYGVDTCWYNRRKIEVPKGYNPTYVISGIDDVIGIVNI